VPNTILATYPNTLARLRTQPRKWLVTGCAGFIGSHLLATLLDLDQQVVGIDNFSTGDHRNLDACRDAVGPIKWQHFTFLRGSVSELATCRAACTGVDAVLHQAGFVSVPASVEHPLECHETNVTGTLNLLAAAHEAGVKNFVYASSAAVYGDEATMPQREEFTGRPLSPYGASKAMGEQYAGLFARLHGVHCIGLRYFNVFGPRQDPEGGYAAVVPRWISTLAAGGQCVVNGDGNQTRDFCPVANVVQANLLAATSEDETTKGEVYNVALGGTTSLLELHAMIARKLLALDAARKISPPRRGPPRPGDITHSSADITKIRTELGYEPQVTVDAALGETVQWYAAQAERAAPATSA
jgi:UDP-N-acetylglucosamine 4-epimerase